MSTKQKFHPQAKSLEADLLAWILTMILALSTRYERNGKLLNIQTVRKKSHPTNAGVDCNIL